MKYLFVILFITSAFFTKAQDNVTYLKANAIRIENTEKLNDSIYTMLSPFQVVMIGEMHGTNESAPFVSGLTKLFTNNGDSVLVGLEISAELMSKFNLLQTDSSIYQSDFFSKPPYLDGRESISWANLIAKLCKNPKVKVFFFDTNRDSVEITFRDSIMAMNIKSQFNQHPTWKMITLSGNYHNKISDANTMASVFKRHVSTKSISLNIEYKEGSANANFSHGIEIKQLGSYPSVFNSTESYDCYLLLYSPNSNYDYNGFYYTKYITAAKMVSSK